MPTDIYKVNCKCIRSSTKHDIALVSTLKYSHCFSFFCDGPKIVKAIDDIITDDNTRLDELDGIKCKLQVCDGLLVFWKKCVEHVSALEKIRVVCVASLCDILPETTRIIFKHCKARYVCQIHFVKQNDTHSKFLRIRMFILRITLLQSECKVNNI